MKKSHYITISVLMILGTIFLVNATNSGGMSYLSIPAASFQPTGSDCKFTNSGGGISNNGVLGGCSYFIAPVQLPSGVTIKKVTFFWKDESVDYEAYLMLNNTTLNGYSNQLFVIPTNGSAGVSSSSSIDTSILVDNSQYGYFFSIQMPSDGISEIYGVQIEYTYETILPLVIR